jgi:hypothetical protein
MPEPPSPRGEGVGTVRIQQHAKLKFETFTEFFENS